MAVLLCLVSFMLSVANNSIMLSAIMPSVVAPLLLPVCDCGLFVTISSTAIHFKNDFLKSFVYFNFTLVVRAKHRPLCFFHVSFWKTSFQPIVASFNINFAFLTTHIQMDRPIIVLINTCAYGQTDGLTDGEQDRWTDTWFKWWKDRQMDG